MAENEREFLQKAIDEVQSYDQDKRAPYSLEYFLLKLHDVDLSVNSDLWQQLRSALAQSQQVNRKETRKFLTRKYFAEEGYWWWDPGNWKDVDES